MSEGTLRPHKQKRSSNLGTVEDPFYGKLDVKKVGAAGKGEKAYLVKGQGFGPEWRDQSELLKVNLNKKGKTAADKIID